MGHGPDCRTESAPTRFVGQVPGVRVVDDSRADIAFLIGSLLDPQCGVLSVGHGRTRNGSIPPSLDRGRRLGRRSRSFRFREAPQTAPDIASARCWADTSAVNIRHRRILLVGATIVAALAIAIPVMGADPSPSAGPPVRPSRTSRRTRTSRTRPRKPRRHAEVAVTVKGTVTKGTDEDGSPDLLSDRRRQDLAAVGRPELVLGRQEPAERLRRQVGLDRGKHPCR